MTGERAHAGAWTDLAVGVASLLVLGSVIAVPVLVRSLDERSFLSAESQRLDVMQLVEAHGRDVAQRVFFDVALEPRKIELVTCDVPLTWSIAAMVLDLNDVVIDERVAHAEKILFVHRRRTCWTHGPPLQPIRGADVELATAVVGLRKRRAADIFAVIRPIVFRDVNRVTEITYVRGIEALIVVDEPPKTRAWIAKIRDLDR